MIAHVLLWAVVLLSGLWLMFVVAIFTGDVFFGRKRVLKKRTKLYLRWLCFIFIISLILFISTWRA